jgi:probable phosphoglycerate mutase
MQTTVYLTRHGETVWNREGRVQGHLDSPLTELGIQQATWLRDALIDVDFHAVYSSTSPRAHHTAQIIHAGRVCEIQTRDDLREIFMDDFEGKVYREMQELFPERMALRETPHLFQPTYNEETYYELQKRIVVAFNELVAQHEGQTLLVVSHGVTLKVLLASLEGRHLSRLWEPPHMHSTALSKVVVRNGQPIIEFQGDTSHYSAEEPSKV